MDKRIKLFGVLITILLGSSITVTLTFADIISGSYTTANSNDVTTTQLTIDKPTVSKGEFMLANISVNGGSSAVITAPAGWTQILRTDNDTNVALISYWKIAGASEPSSYTWLINHQTTAKGAITPYAGVDISDPIIAAAGNTGFGHAATTTSINTSTASSTLVALYAINVGKNNNAGDYFSIPTGLTEKYDVSNTPYGPSSAQFEVVQAAGGDTGSKLSNITGKKRDWAAQIIALRYDGPKWTAVSSNAPWGPRTVHAMLSYDGKMWVIGGTDAISKNYADDWSSTDGINWTEVASSTPWSARDSFAAVTFNGKMWVMGGVTNEGWKNDVWSSTDGINWTEVTASAPWSGREDLSTIVYDNKIWVIGGLSDSGRTHDVWSSTDGVNWTEETSAASWSKRTDETVITHNNKMWVLGGLDDNGLLNDVWYSTDGADWIEQTSPIIWDARSAHASTEYNDKIWVTGGSGESGALSDVWSSTE